MFYIKLQRKGHTQKQFLFEMTNQLTINFSDCYYTNFDRDKLLPEKSFIILLITSQKWVELTSKVSYVQGE